MRYSGKEARQYLETKISELQIDTCFKKNPAYNSIITEIKDLICNESEGQIIVNEEGDKKTSFVWISSSGEKYSMSISCSNPQTFSHILTKEKKQSFIDSNHPDVKIKKVVEKVTTIDEKGNLTLTTNESIVDNMNCYNSRNCNEYTISERKCYTANGVLDSKETKRFPKFKLDTDFNSADINSMLFISRQAFNGF